MDSRDLHSKIGGDPGKDPENMHRSIRGAAARVHIRESRPKQLYTVPCERQLY